MNYTFVELNNLNEFYLIPIMLNDFNIGNYASLDARNLSTFDVMILLTQNEVYLFSSSAISRFLLHKYAFVSLSKSCSIHYVSRGYVSQAQDHSSFSSLSHVRSNHFDMIE